MADTNDLGFSHEPDISRRDFIHVATGAFAATGAALVAWPLIHQMNPSADVKALATVEVDLSAVEAGQAIKVFWRGKPVFIRNRTETELEEARAVDVSALRDPQTDVERTVEGHENFLIVVGACTHLGCIPLGTAVGEQKGDYDGWFCPCHGSHYDISGRIRKGPAPKNLEVPYVEFLTPTTVQIGQEV
ncbi:MAG: ubiquinol-cytochrome c reductase iron-sulfur subunit [Pseudomonadota bacterium]